MLGPIQVVNQTCHESCGIHSHFRSTHRLARFGLRLFPAGCRDLASLRTSNWSQEDIHRPPGLIGGQEHVLAPTHRPASSGPQTWPAWRAGGAQGPGAEDAGPGPLGRRILDLARRLLKAADGCWGRARAPPSLGRRSPTRPDPRGPKLTATRLGFTGGAAAKV